MIDSANKLHAEVHAKRVVFIGVLVTTLIGMAVRITALAWDSLNYDVYDMMVDVDKPFAQYVEESTFGKTLLAYWWVISRTLGEGINAHRAIPLLCNIAAMFGVAYHCYRELPTTGYSAIYSTLMFALSSWATYTVAYPVVSYSLEVLLGVMIYLITWRVCVNPVEPRGNFFYVQVGLIVILSAMASYTIVVPACISLCTAMIWCVVSSATKKEIGVKLRKSLCLSPLVIVILIQGGLWALIPFEHLGDNLLQHMYAYFFNKSDYSQTMTGAIGFAANNSRYWIKGLMAPVANEELFTIAAVPQVAFYGTIVCMIVSASIYGLIRKRSESAFAIPLIYAVVAWLALLLGGLVSMYPFGTVRYSGWLLMPIAILFGLSMGTVIVWLQAKFGRAVTNLFTFAFIMFGITVSVLFFYLTIEKTRQNYLAVSALAELEKVDKLLFSEFLGPPLVYLSKNSGESNKLLSMGWGKHHKTVDEQIPNSEDYSQFKAGIESGIITRVSICAENQERFKMLHPSWYDLLQSYFALKQEVKGPDIWVGSYVAKGDDEFGK